jgi:hypothetical protein
MTILNIDSFFRKARCHEQGLVKCQCMDVDKQIGSVNVIMKHLLEETNRLSVGSVVKQTFCN